MDGHTADALIARILASRVWHVLYPFMEGGCCYIMDGATWDRMVTDKRWYRAHEDEAAHAAWVFEAQGQSVYAADCVLKPYRYQENLILVLPDKDAVGKWAHTLGKLIIMHRLEGNAYHGYSHREVYRVGPIPPAGT